MKENTVSQFASLGRHNSFGDELSDYVAHLQLHMALQARNLVPHLSSDRSTNDSRSLLLQQTQAEFEKLVSRQ